MHARRVALAPLLCLFLLLACAATPPPFEHRTALGSARAASAEQAHETAEIAAELAPEVARRLGLEPGPPFVIWRVPDDHIHTNGLMRTTERRGKVVKAVILVRESIAGDELRYVVAHELVHWYARWSPWHSLPLVVEEGIAEHIAIELAPGHGAARERRLRSSLAWASRVDRSAALAVPRLGRSQHRADDDAPSFHTIGWNIVDLLGFDALQAFIERARAEELPRVPIAWIEAALDDARCKVCKDHHRWTLVGRIPVDGPPADGLVDLEPRRAACPGPPSEE